MFVCVCVCVSVITLELLRDHHEISMGSRYGQKLRRIKKWLHSAAVHRVGGNLASLAF